MIRRQKFGLVAAMPFSDDVRRVARAAQHVGERLLGGIEADALPGEEHAASFEGVEADPAGMAAREHRAARRRTDRRALVEMREPTSLRGEAIEIRRRDLLLAVDSDLAPAEVVGEDEDDVQFVGGGQGAGQAKTEGGEGCKFHGKP